MEITLLPIPELRSCHHFLGAYLNTYLDTVNDEYD